MSFSDVQKNLKEGFQTFTCDTNEPFFQRIFPRAIEKENDFVCAIFSFRDFVHIEKLSESTLSLYIVRTTQIYSTYCIINSLREREKPIYCQK